MNNLRQDARGYLHLMKDDIEKDVRWVDNEIESKYNRFENSLKKDGSWIENKVKNEFIDISDDLKKMLNTKREHKFACKLKHLMQKYWFVIIILVVLFAWLVCKHCDKSPMVMATKIQPIQDIEFTLVSDY
jgi:hypothetical protein